MIFCTLASSSLLSAQQKTPTMPTDPCKDTAKPPIYSNSKDKDTTDEKKDTAKPPLYSNPKDKDTTQAEKRPDPGDCNLHPPLLGPKHPLKGTNKDASDAK